MLKNHKNSGVGNVDQTTSDSLFEGKIQVIQPIDGYRFSIDSVILAGLSAPVSGATVLDLGTGCGVIPLILAYKISNIFLTGVELQSELAELASLNIKRNGMQDRISILHQDLCTLSTTTLGGTVDYVISNPPYRPKQSGRINPNSQKAVARHELAMNLSELITTVRNVLRVGGKFITIYPAERLTDLIYQMRKKSIEPKTLHMIFSRKDESAKLVVVEGVRAGRPGIQKINPFVIYRPDGRYTAEMMQIFENGIKGKE